MNIIGLFERIFIYLPVCAVVYVRVSVCAGAHECVPVYAGVHKKNAQIAYSFAKLRLS